MASWLIHMLIFISIISSKYFISFSVLLQVKFKIALCHSAICEHREALQEVPPLSFTSDWSSFWTLNPILREQMIWSMTCWSICFLQMEGIPSKLRTLKMNLMLGKLFRISRNNRSATVCYKECLRCKISNALFFSFTYAVLLLNWQKLPLSCCISSYFSASYRNH